MINEIVLLLACRGDWSGVSGYNRPCPENTFFETFVPSSLKFHTISDIHTTEK